jgi:hypothetical protein
MPGAPDILAPQGTDERIHSMNLAGVLLPKAFLSTVLIVSFCTSPSFGQNKKKLEPSQQTSV